MEKSNNMSKIIQLLGTHPGFRCRPTHSKLQQNTRDLVKMSSVRMKGNTPNGARNMGFCKNVPSSYSKSVEKMTFSLHCSWGSWRELYQVEVPLQGDERSQDRTVGRERNGYLGPASPSTVALPRGSPASAQTLAKTRNLFLQRGLIYSQDSSQLSSTFLGKLTESVEIENVFFLPPRDAEGSMCT